MFSSRIVSLSRPLSRSLSTSPIRLNHPQPTPDSNPSSFKQTVRISILYIYIYIYMYIYLNILWYLKKLIKQASRYRLFASPFAKVFLGGIFTYQVIYWTWLKLEMDESKWEKRRTFPFYFLSSSFLHSFFTFSVILEERLI